MLVKSDPDKPTTVAFFSPHSEHQTKLANSSLIDIYLVTCKAVIKDVKLTN